LKTLATACDEFSSRFAVLDSFHAYSSKSPSYADNTGKTYLLSEATILGRGTIQHMHDGSVDIAEYEQYTLGVLLTGLTMILYWVTLPCCDMPSYFSWIDAEKALRKNTASDT